MAKLPSVITYIVVIRKEDGNYFSSTGMTGELTPDKKIMLEAFTSEIAEGVNKLNKEFINGQRPKTDKN